MSDDDLEDAVKLERRLTLMETSIATGLASLTTAVQALTGKVGEQNGRVGALEQRKIVDEAREEGRGEITRRHLGWATGGLASVIVLSQVAIQAFW